MLQFNIQADSEIPASQQLLDQIQFAIASGQYPPGHRLPSTRQLAMITGLHRNTISKVYRQLEETGLVESLAGSGIYVKTQGYDDTTPHNSPLLEQYPEAKKLIQTSISELLAQGCSLAQVRQLLLDEIDWRLRCSTQVFVTVPARDIFAGELVYNELEQALDVAVELVALEELPPLLEKSFATVVTIPYFISEVLKVVPPTSARVIAIDIYDYAKELEIVKGLPQQACLGIVSLSAPTLRVAESIVHSLRGDDLLIVTAQASDAKRLSAVVRSAHTVISDPASYDLVKQTVSALREDLIRPPEVIRSENYIGTKSIEFLEQELGLGIALAQE